jgi:hypothetical protein
MNSFRTGMHAIFWWENLNERDHLENLGIDKRIILKWVLKIAWEEVNRFIRMVGRSGGLL